MSTDGTLDATEPLEPLVPPAAYDPAGPSSRTAPRTRWAAIVWGLFLGALAITGLVLVGDPARRVDLAASVDALSAGSLIAGAVLCIGVLVLVGGVAGLIRHAQRRLSR